MGKLAWDSTTVNCIFLFPFSSRVNVGSEFQAELPLCPVDAKKTGLWTADDESAREQLLWKPRDRMDESSSLRVQGKCTL